MGKNAERAIEKSSFSFISMIDVVFLLLIFFMLTSKFKQSEERIDAFLPQDGPNLPPVDSPTELFIFVKDDRILQKSSNWQIQSTRRAAFFLATRDAQPVRNPASLLPVLRQLASNPEQRILVSPYDERLDQRVPFFNIVNLVDTCKSAGIHQVQFRAPHG